MASPSPSLSDQIELAQETAPNPGRQVFLRPRGWHRAAPSPGSKGLGQLINENGQIVLCLQFDDGAKELVAEKP